MAVRSFAPRCCCSPPACRRRRRGSTTGRSCAWRCPAELIRWSATPLAAVYTGADPQRDPRADRAGRSGRAVPVRQRAGQSARQLARLPDRRDLLRGALGDARRPARGGAGGAQPRPPSGLSEQRLRRRLSGLAAPHRLPVQLHLRRIDAARRAQRRRAGRRRGRSRRRRWPASSIRRSASPPIITPPRSAPGGRRR